MRKRLLVLVCALLTVGLGSTAAGAASPPSKPIIMEQKIGFTYHPYQFNRQFPGELMPMIVMRPVPLRITSSNWRAVIPVGGWFGIDPWPKCGGPYNPVYPTTQYTGFEAIGVGKAVVSVTSRYGKQIYDVTTAKVLPDGDYYAFDGHYIGDKFYNLRPKPR